MCKNKILIFISKLNSLDDYYFTYYSIAYGIAPTIYDQKPSSIITINNKRNMLSIWETNKEDICIKLGCKYIEMKSGKDSIQVMFYKEKLLQNTIFNKGNLDYLVSQGYKRSFNLIDFLSVLSDRLEKGCPHEMGIFLGIPLIEIKAFIKNKGEGYIVNSYWKVYNNLEEALTVFDNYDNAKILIMNQVEKIAC